MIPLGSSRSDANKYPQERLGNQFLVAMPNNMAMINRARKIYDRLSEYGDLGHLLWGSTINRRSPDEKDLDIDEVERLHEEVTTTATMRFNEVQTATMRCIYCLLLHKCRPLFSQSETYWYIQLQAG
jgi:hypothetical protein